MASIDHLLVNGRIHTLDPQQPHADSIAIAGDQIVAVGGHDLRSLITPTTKITDLGGAMVVPGLTDAHLHWEGTARALKSIDLLDIPSKQAAIDKVAAAAQNVSPGAWLVGRGWSQSIWKDTDGAFPSAADLDAITPNNPVYLPARSGHAAWVNSAALRAGR
jgi:predicted amidohydrolase YtcJ